MRVNIHIKISRGKRHISHKSGVAVFRPDILIGLINSLLHNFGINRPSVYKHILHITHIDEFIGRRQQNS